MIPSLVKTKEGWLVTFTEDGTAIQLRYATIESAADKLNAFGVSDDAIDDAVIAIYTFTGDHPKVSAAFNDDGFSHVGGEW